MSFVESIRLTELNLVIKEIRERKPSGSSILEIGGGAGWQAKKLSESGFTVVSLDLPQSLYSGVRVWPIIEYDGECIPFADNYFDIVFSSSALEHIPHLEEFQNEMKRVLKSDGYAVHVVPSGVWRFWTTVTHYPFIIKTLLAMIWQKFVGVKGESSGNQLEELARVRIKQLSKVALLKQALVPQRHGETGTAFSEIYYFSRNRWLALFEQSGWYVEGVLSNRLLYSGYMILGTLLSISCRTKLSAFLGSACHIFILRKSRPALNASTNLRHNHRGEAKKGIY